MRGTNASSPRPPRPAPPAAGTPQPDRATYGAPGPATGNVVRNTLGVYRTPLIEVNTKCVFSNTTPVGAYRGAGRPEANYYMERLVDTAAAETGIDRIELRRRNHIAPEAMPYKSPNGQTYDSE